MIGRILMLLGLLLLAGFVVFNFEEFMRPSMLSFGGTVAEAPLGLLMLGVVVLMLVALVASNAWSRRRTVMERGHHYKTLEETRTLADNAEASRFTDLRNHIDARLRELRERDEITATEFHRAGIESQRELRNQLEQMNRAMMARLAEIETRLDARLDRVAPPMHLSPEQRLREEDRLRAEHPRADLEPPPRVRHPL